MALVRCIINFSTSIRGSEEEVHAGDVLDETHELVTSTPAAWWTPVTEGANVWH